MRAVVHDRYGGPEVLRLEEVERPVPADDEVLVRIHATTVTRTDCHIRAAKPFVWRAFAGLLRPKRRILGLELAGEVEAVGPAVTEFAVGDAVFGGSPGRFGAHAEFVCVREGAALAHKPSGMSFEQAAAVCDGFYQASSALRTAELRQGQRILVYGASGSLGTAAVQLARHLGAHVTAVCGTKNVELVRSLGADEVVDYQERDYTKNGETYHVVLDAVGFHHFSQCRGSIRPGGVFVPTELGRLMVENLLLTLATKLFRKRQVRFGVARWSRRDVLLVKELIEAGEYRAVIDRSYPLEDVVAATRYVETLQKTGNVVLTVGAGGGPVRAVVHDRYGPPEVLRLADIEKPVPKAGEILIRIRATTVNRSDCGWRAPHPFFSRVFTGLLRPKRPTLGSELAGVVEAVGAGVTRFEAGDEVFGIKSGAHAEYVCARESAAVAHKPAAMSFEEAAAVCDGGIIALTCLRKARLQEGQSIVVYGASGSIGTAAVQLAKAFGAEVTAVCNTKNVELVRSLGADEVVDYTAADFTRNGRTYDVVFDAVGRHSFRRCRRSVKPGGVYIETDLGYLWHAPLLALLTRWIGDKRVTIPIPKYTQDEVVFLKELIEAGRYRAAIDRRYPLEDVVAATTYVETGQKTGNVVLTVADL